ncbi:MAG: hypothetical protein J7L59_02530 [Nanoarchaeota archaeon]|nr:hypothetical protein [Nanoarchaeota archaeon]
MEEKKVPYQGTLKALPLPGTVKPPLAGLAKALYDAQYLLLTEGPKEAKKTLESYVKETAKGLSKAVNSPEFDRKMWKTIKAAAELTGVIVSTRYLPLELVLITWTAYLTKKVATRKLREYRRKSSLKNTRRRNKKREDLEASLEPSLFKL